MSDSNFNPVMRDEGPRKRGLVDDDRRDGDRSLSIDTFGDLKLFWATTGVVADGAEATVYLTRNAKAQGASMFTKRPQVSVERDGNASAGGFARGQGPEKPSSSYVARDRGDVWRDVKWISNTEVFAVVVTNKSGVASDFIVTAQGV